MSAAAMPGVRAADPGAGVARAAARRTPDAAPDTFGALLASHGPAPARVRVAAGQPSAKPEVDSPQTGRSPHRGAASRGRSVSSAADDAEVSGADTLTPSPTTTGSPAARAPEAAPGVGCAADAPTAAQTPSSTTTPAPTELGVPAVPSSTDSPTAQRIPATATATAATATATAATAAATAATAAAPGAPATVAAAATAVTPDPDPVAAVAAPGASRVTEGVVATGPRHTAVRDGGPVTPASADAAAGPVMPTAAFSVPATVVAPTTSGPTASTPSPPSVPAAPVPTQVLAAVSPFVRGDDGSYAVQLQLHPHDLGAVQVTVDVRHGEISVHLHTPDGAAQDALRDGLADLRRQLEEQGLRTGSMEVGSGGPQQQREDARRQPVGLVVPGTRAPAAGPGPATGGATTALDLRM